MTHLIDKDALVAEIEILREQDYPCDTFEESTGYYNALDEIATFLDTLETKEVGINKEISRFIDTNFEKATIGHKLSLRRTAKHFFELGMAASNKAQKGEKV